PQRLEPRAEVVGQAAGEGAAERQVAIQDAFETGEGAGGEPRPGVGDDAGPDGGLVLLAGRGQEVVEVAAEIAGEAHAAGGGELGVDLERAVDLGAGERGGRRGGGANGRRISSWRRRPAAGEDDQDETGGQDGDEPPRLATGAAPARLDLRAEPLVLHPLQPDL